MPLNPVAVIVTEAASEPAQPIERTYNATSWTITEDGYLHINYSDFIVATYNPHCWNSVRQATA